jgi:VCBS repeat-containing protein
VDSFTYRPESNGLLGSTATVTVTVAPVDDAPVASADTASVAEDVVLNGSSVLLNDNDVDGDALEAQLVTSASHGVVVLAANGTYTYTPAQDFFGTDTFTYRVLAAGVVSAPAVVTVTVTAVDDLPVAVADTAGPAIAGRAYAGSTVLTNDSDVDGDALTAALVTQPAHGAVVLAANGTYTYTAAASYVGTDSFTYAPVAAGATGAAVAVTITVDAFSRLDTLTSTSPVTNLPFATTNLSGIARHGVTGSYYTVENGGATITEYASDLVTRVRTIQLTPAVDLEDIVWIRDDIFAVASETKRSGGTVVASNQVAFIDLAGGVTTATPAVYRLLPESADNKGLEGITYDVVSGLIYVVQEQAPVVWAFLIPADLVTPSVVTVTPVEPFSAVGVTAATDLSGIAFDVVTRRLLLLSHETSRIYEVSTTGTLIGTKVLPSGNQFEGIAFDDAAGLVVVGEPNKLVRLQPGGPG